MKYWRIVIYFSLSFLNSCSYCDFIKEQESKEFNGKIIEKKVYEWDRGKKVLFIQNAEKTVKYYFPTNYAYDDYWHAIIIGDSINKENVSKRFNIFREDTLALSFLVNFDCQ
jgi:hypothetical protein